MMWLKAALDPYILVLMGAVLLASVLPPVGVWASVFDVAANAGITLLFFLHGAKLSREAIWAGATKWRLHGLVLATTFVLFPILGLIISHIPGLPVAMAMGMLFLTLLPSTVQSSIAFTAIARGDVAAALCSASFSNLLGVFITPLLVFALMGGSAVAISAGVVQKIVFLLLIPFCLGHLLRPVIGSWVVQHKALVSYVDRGSIILVVYVAFGAAVVEGLWDIVSLTDLSIITLLCCILLGVVMGWTSFMGRILRFSREDAIVLLFCGSKKSLATGVPIAGVLFPVAQVGQILLPLMLFHQIQLVVCAIIARRMAQAQEHMQR